MPEIDLPPGEYRGGHVEPKLERIVPAILLVSALACGSIPLFVGAMSAREYILVGFVAVAALVAGWAVRALQKPRPIHYKTTVEQVIPRNDGTGFRLPFNRTAGWIWTVAGIIGLGWIYWNRQGTGTEFFLVAGVAAAVGGLLMALFAHID